MKMLANNGGHVERGMGLKQEDYNAMMRWPDESNRAVAAHELPKCPRCKERYCGDGTQLCSECAIGETP